MKTELDKLSLEELVNLIRVGIVYLPNSYHADKMMEVVKEIEVRILKPVSGVVTSPDST